MELTILGRGKSKELCKFDTETWATVSILGDEGFRDKPYSKLFIFDNPSDVQWERVNYAKTKGITVIGRSRFDFVDEKYPKNEIIKRFNTLFFVNSASHMLALAIHKGYDHLHLLGFDPTDRKGYNLTRKYITFWLGVADGMGVKWDTTKECYGWFFE